ncbi:hypothetical protein LX32DRAFT_234825 [Colletotrichum zoysiae]|uniref:Uncharacterized protein n=1 Tax=Colletotrichum zoysiae TaxID=1216348 RepID=A0AAD9LTU7_9PEZI|nr:hypothetical protein LX32DRAFT_234825 [Colletotrichum zoysiae]
MSAKINLIRGADGQLLYKASDGHWYPYSSMAHSSPSHDSSQQYMHDSTHSQRSTQQEEPQYNDEDCEAGSFQGDSYINESRKPTSSTRGQSKKRVLKYVEDQRKEREHRDEPRDNSRSRRRTHKKSIKKDIEKILGPLKS